MERKQNSSKSNQLANSSYSNVITFCVCRCVRVWSVDAIVGDGIRRKRGRGIEGEREREREREKERYKKLMTPNIAAVLWSGNLTAVLSYKQL